MVREHSQPDPIPIPVRLDNRGIVCYNGVEWGTHFGREAGRANGRLSEVAPSLLNWDAHERVEA